MSRKMKKIKAWKLDEQFENNKRMPDINLTVNTMRKVLSYLTYEEKLPVRLVSRSFNKVISKTLNEEFHKMGEKIENALDKASKRLKQSNLKENTIRHFKILYYLRSEHNVMKITMQKYLENSLVTFSGGSILDCFHRTLRTDQIQGNNDHMKIFHLIEVYLNNFCMEVNDIIKLKAKKPLNECFGMKIFDILDCGLEYGRNIQFSHGPDCIYLEGEYHAKEANLFEDIPDMNRQTMSELEMMRFLQMMRNNVRWSNLLYCIQKETSDLAQDFFTPVQKITSRTNLTLRKDLTKVLDEKEKDISYILTLKCSRDDLPPKFVKLVKDYLSCNVCDWSTQKNVSADSPNEFNLLIKMKSKTEGGGINEKVVKLYHIGDECVSSEFNKLISLLR